MKITDAMKKRKSVRTYDGKRLSEKDRTAVVNHIKSLKADQKGLRFIFLDVDDASLSDIKGLTSYGTLKGTKTVLTCIMKNDVSLVDYGYIIEQVILFAEGLGIATCWLGGTFSRGAFLKALTLEPNETLPVIVPMGYAAEKQSQKSMLIRYMIKADKRKPFDTLFFDSREDIPLSAERAGWAYEALEMVRIAPSASNKQPWRIIMNADGNFDFYLSRTKGYGNGMGYDIQMIDMGIAACHFVLTAKELGKPGKLVNKQPPECPRGLEYIITFKIDSK